MREYWIVFKNGKYIANTDEFGYPEHTTEITKAWKFYDFNIAMLYFDFGYAIIKQYEI